MAKCSNFLALYIFNYVRMCGLSCTMPKNFQLLNYVCPQIDSGMHPYYMFYVHLQLMQCVVLCVIMVSV